MLITCSIEVVHRIVVTWVQWHNAERSHVTGVARCMVVIDAQKSSRVVVQGSCDLQWCNVQQAQ